MDVGVCLLLLQFYKKGKESKTILLANRFEVVAHIDVCVVSYSRSSAVLVITI